MSIQFHGQTYWLQVQTGEGGVQQFQADVKRLLDLNSEDDFDITFECQVPGEGEWGVALPGWQASLSEVVKGIPPSSQTLHFCKRGVDTIQAMDSCANCKKKARASMPLLLEPASEAGTEAHFKLQAEQKPPHNAITAPAMPAMPAHDLVLHHSDGSQR